MPLSSEKHCEMLSANVRHRDEAMVGGFKLFIQLYSAIVGGSLVLRLQSKEAIPPSIVGLSDWLAVLVAVAAMALVIDSFRSRKEHRWRLSEVAGRDETGNLIIPKPHRLKSSVTFAVMVALITAAPFLFYWFNSLR